jgi:putative transposase
LDFEILALEIPGDNVHMFESAPQKWSPAKIMRRFKGRSSRLLMKKYIHL